MRELRFLVVLSFAVAVAGCAGSWLNEPSPSVKALVRDLTLQGFECSAGLSEIICSQKNAFLVKQASPCDENGCYESKPKYRADVYRIRQSETGMPLIEHTTKDSAAE